MLKRKLLSLISIGLCLIFVLTSGGETGYGNEKSIYIDSAALESASGDEVTIEEEAVALAGDPAAVNAAGGVVGAGNAAGEAAAVNVDSISGEAAAVSVGAAAVPSGVLTAQNGKAVIDYSNTADGYVMVQYTAGTAKRLKAQVKGPATAYTYNLPAQSWVTFPLSDGNGNYQVTVFENVVDNRYAAVISASFAVSLENEFAPFIRPNQYVDYSVAPNTVNKAAELTAGILEPLEKVEAVYQFTVKNLTYDYNKAAAVKSGYLPVLDQVLAEKKGICFDYAALMAGMLRSQGIPCKLVVGYAGTVYHAWISVWTEKTGWVDGVIYFDGKSWHRMDPTFASSGGQSSEIMSYIENGANYTAKYIY